MEDALTLSRLQFAFTVTYHYLFSTLTMGLALLIFVLKSAFMRNRNELYNRSTRFWAKIFAVTFVMGVVTGIPLEFQFGTNWAAFSEFSEDIIAQTHDERLDAEPGRLPDAREWQHRAQRLLGDPAQPVDVPAVRA